mmetsp:Transcript_16071/g.32153  ORF Transcript_16071/g.32153 Transcript_16071/m.32153 type:complete len:259 (-) Transcript_16071:185-961(-)
MLRSRVLQTCICLSSGQVLPQSFRFLIPHSLPAVSTSAPFCRFHARMTSSAKEIKAQLRKDLRAKLAVLDDAVILQNSALVANQLFEHPSYQQSKGVACFVSMPKEFNTRPMLERILKDGKSLYLPRVISVKERQMVMLKAFSLEDIDNFPKGKWGIPEPPTEGPVRVEALDENSDLDLFVVPGLAFDKQNGRMGQGAGFYDTYLSQALARSQARKEKLSLVGVTLDELMIESVPRDEHDILMDCVLWPSKLKEGAAT